MDKTKKLKINKIILNQDDIDSLKKTFENFKPVMAYFERDILLPRIKGQLEYLITIFEEFKVIASNPSVATHIDAAIKKVADEGKINIGPSEPKVGVAYLESIKEQLDSSFILPIKQLIETKFSNIDEISNDYVKIIDAMNATYNEVQSIVACKEKLFKYSFRSFPNLKHTKTQEVILGEPTEVTLGLMPFDIRVDELVNVVETMMATINGWTADIRDQQKKNREIIIKLSEIKAIKEGQKHQLLLIVVSLVLIVLAFTFGFSGNQFLEKKQLKDELISLSSEMKHLSNEHNALKKQSNQEQVTLKKLTGKNSLLLQEKSSLESENIDLEKLNKLLNNEKKSLNTRNKSLIEENNK